MCVEGRNLHVVPVQTRVAQIRLAVQKGRRALHSVTEVVVVITERDCMLINYISEPFKKKDLIFLLLWNFIAHSVNVCAPVLMYV